MPRAKNNVAAHRRHKKILKKARGNYGARSRLYRTALETVHKGLTYAYRDRRNGGGQGARAELFVLHQRSQESRRRS